MAVAPTAVGVFFVSAPGLSPFYAPKKSRLGAGAEHGQAAGQRGPARPQPLLWVPAATERAAEDSTGMEWWPAVALGQQAALPHPDRRCPGRTTQVGGRRVGAAFLRRGHHAPTPAAASPGRQALAADPLDGDCGGRCSQPLRTFLAGGCSRWSLTASRSLSAVAPLPDTSLLFSLLFLGQSSDGVTHSSSC